MTSGTRIKIYAGLSVSRAEVHSVLPEAEVAGPVKRGDTLLDIRRGTNVIAIVDGRFQDVLAVSPTELMDCLRCGVRVYGSSSMGALRAVELEPFGMIGVGEVYEYIRATPYFRDDLLGQRFSDRTEEQSEPYVNFMFSLKRLHEAGEIDAPTQAVLDGAYRDLHFGDRDRAGLTAKLKAEHSESSEHLVAIANRAFSFHNQKKTDAHALLKRIKTDLEEVANLNALLNEAGQHIPTFEGLYPSQEEYEREVMESRERLRAARAAVLRSLLEPTPASLEPESGTAGGTPDSSGLRKDGSS